MIAEREPGGSRARGRALTRALPTLAVLGGGIALVVRERTSVADALTLIGDSASMLWIAAFAALVAGRGVLSATSFVVATRDLAQAPAGLAATAWLRSAIAKYVPGVIWYPLTAVDRLRRSGVGATGAASAFYVDAVGSIVAAIIIGAIALPTFIAAEAGSAAWLVLAVPAAASLHPRVFAIGLRVMGRLTSRRIDIRLRWRTVATVVALHAGAWLAAGAGLQLVLHAIGSGATWSLVLAATSLSWAAGLLAIPIPAGLGIREAALIALLVTEIPAPTAVAAALASRVLYVALDVTSLAASFPAAALVTQPATTSTDQRSAHG